MEPNAPRADVSWCAVTAFCRRLDVQLWAKGDRPVGWGLRLLTATAWRRAAAPDERRMGRGMAWCDLPTDVDLMSPDEFLLISPASVLGFRLCLAPAPTTG